MDPRDITHSNPDIVPQEHGLAGVAGTKFETILQGFQEGVFQEEMEEFVRKHAPEFAAVCQDGSYPLQWSSIHEEYKHLFNAQLEYILWTQNLTKERFVELCESMRHYSDALLEDAALPDIFPDDPHRQGFQISSVAQFRYFLLNLTASEDFGRFLHVMFAAVAGTLRTTTLLDSSGSVDVASPQIHEIEVIVPAGVLPGQMIAIEFLGTRYEVMVPEGCEAGATFKTSVTLSN